MTAKGVTSEPVPAEVGTAMKAAFSPILGKVYTRLRMSMNRMAMSMKSASGCSYITHMILPASMAEPPPMAMMQSGPKARIRSAPVLAQARVGSGATS